MSFAGAALLKGLPGEYLHSEAGSKKKKPQSGFLELQLSLVSAKQSQKRGGISSKSN